MRRRKSLVFRTVKQDKRRRHLRFVAVMLAVLVAGSAATFLLFMQHYDFDLGNAFEGIAERRRQETSDEEGKPVIEECTYDILLFAAEENRSSIDFMCMMKVTVPDNELVFACFSPFETVTVGEKTQSFTEIYYSLGPKGLMNAVESRYGVRPDGYVSSTGTGFASVINYYGGISTTVSPSVSWESGDYSLILSDGYQILKGDSLINYIRYQYSRGESGIRNSADLISAVAKMVIDSANGKDVVSTYSYLANRVSTSISIVDFSKASAGLQALADGEVSYITVSGVEEYVKAGQQNG